MAKITTTRGDMDESALWKRTHVIEDANELTHVTEYWYPRDGRVLKDKECVHRSVHVALKDGVETVLELEKVA